MAPAVPFALLGVVTLASVATWLGFAAASCLPRQRRRTTPLVVLGSAVLAVADALTALRLSSAQSDGIGELRVLGLALLAAGFLAALWRPRSSAMASILAPLGARPSIAVLAAALGAVAATAAAVGGLRGSRDGMPARQRSAQRRLGGWLTLALVLTAVAAALADPARHSTDAALAVLSARGAASLAMVGALVVIARDNLLGKLLGAIVAGVVAMAIGAVAVVGIGVAGEVQHDQSQRLLSVAMSQKLSLPALATRAGLYARIVASCPSLTRAKCVSFLKLFADEPGYFAVIDQPGSGVQAVAPRSDVLDSTALLQLAGSAVAQSALKASTSSQAIATGEVLLHGSQPQLAVVAAVAGRPGGSTDVQVKPTFAAIYGIVLNDTYLDRLASQIGYDVSIVSGGQVIASSLGTAGRQAVLTEARAANVDNAGSTTSHVTAAQGSSPTAAFVAVNQAGNDDVRIATLAVSQPASAALAAQRSVLRRLILTALVVLVAVALAAFALAARVVDPLWRLTAAARQVSRGDLDTTLDVTSDDEVGLLAGAFDEMTTSLRSLTGDLRTAVEVESSLRGRLEAVVGSMTDALITTDGEDRVAGANPTALQLLDCDEADVVGQPFADVVDLRDDDGEVVDRRTPLVTDALLHRGEAGEVAVRVAVAPLVDSPGQVVVLSDRTRDREIERLKTEFLSNVSHELRTPLTPIRGYAEMIAHRPDMPREQLQEFVREILAGSMRMNRAVDLLVDVATLEAGRVSPLGQPLVVATLVDDSLARWRSRYPERAGDLRRRLGAKLPLVEVDPLWLGKALDEIVDNAVKYTPTGTPITVAATATDTGDVRVAVRDGGRGFDTSELAQLLGDFSQADASATRHVGGFGLGLAFVTRVAAALGVTLHVSSAPGRGAEFGLDLRVAHTESPGKPSQRR